MILFAAITAGFAGLVFAVGFAVGYEHRTREQADGARLAAGARKCQP